MTFAHPPVLLALILAPVVFGVWAWGGRRAAMSARRISRGAPARPNYLAATLLALAGASAIVAAAQPRWGTRTSELPRRGAELVVVMDISRSMDAQDVQPSRLEAAKKAVNDTVSRLGSDRVGLVVFAGSARLRFPLTTDLAAAQQVVSSLQTGPVFVEGGTNTALGLETAISAFDLKQRTGRVVLLVTDGDNLAADPSSNAVALRNAGVNLLVAGAGTAVGAPVPVLDSGNLPVSLQDASGQTIISKLNEPFLRAVAGAAGGRYLGSDLTLVPGAVQGRLQSLDQAQIDEQSSTLPIERYQWFAVASLVLLLLASAAEYLPRTVVRRTLPALTAVVVMLLAQACATAAYESNEAGRAAMAKGDINGAIAKFTEAQSQAPDDTAPSLNLATALQAAKRYDEATLAAKRALASNDATERGRAWASIGHAQFAAGNMQEALDAFRHALIENPDDSASRHDYEVVLRMLKGPENGQQQQPNQQPGSDGTPQAGDNGSPGQAQPGQTPSPNLTPGAGQGSSPQGQSDQSPGQVGPQSPQQVEKQLSDIDRQVAQLLDESGQQPNTEQALEILRLLEERSRIAGQRPPSGQQSDPNDY